MKTAIRVFALGMLIAGFAADNMLATKPANSTPNTVMVASMNAGPVPTCEPGTKCGFH